MADSDQIAGRPKTLIVCCDGTWNSPDQSGGATNVTKIARAICPENDAGEAQIVYYDEGVGTGNWWDRFLGGAVGVGLSRNVQQAYSFLCLNYRPGDRLVLIGFSRGAFTVRSLGGLIGLVGLLRKVDLDRMPQVWSYYRTPPQERDPTNLDPDWIAQKPDIDALIVWDTVGAMGIPFGLLRWIGRRMYQFHDVKLSRHVRRAYQALAVDEHRRTFAAAVWDTSGGLADGQQVEQRWFAGAHSNVGGGYRNAVLSDVTLRWVKSKVANFVKLDDDFFRRHVGELEPNQPRGTMVNSWARPPWVFLGWRYREIGGDPTETVDDSVRWRCAAAKPFPFEPAPYAPRNLAAYDSLRQAAPTSS
jgi:uncharacterized protein (DUF2235 family)